MPFPPRLSFSASLKMEERKRSGSRSMLRMFSSRKGQSFSEGGLSEATDTYDVGFSLKKVENKLMQQVFCFFPSFLSHPSPYDSFGSPVTTPRTMISTIKSSNTSIERASTLAGETGAFRCFLLFLSLFHRFSPSQNRNLVHVAARNNNIKMVKFLIAAGCDPTERDNRNYTALHVAAENGSEQVVAFLCDECNMNPNVSITGMFLLSIIFRMLLLLALIGAAYLYLPSNKIYKSEYTKYAVMGVVGVLFLLSCYRFFSIVRTGRLDDAQQGFRSLGNMIASFFGIFLLPPYFVLVVIVMILAFLGSIITFFVAIPLIAGLGCLLGIVDKKRSNPFEDVYLFFKGLVTFMFDFSKDTFQSIPGRILFYFNLFPTIGDLLDDTNTDCLRSCYFCGVSWTPVELANKNGHEDIVAKLEVYAAKYNEISEFDNEKECKARLATLIEEAHKARMEKGELLFHEMI